VPALAETCARGSPYNPFLLLPPRNVEYGRPELADLKKRDRCGEVVESSEATHSSTKFDRERLGATSAGAGSVWVRTSDDSIARLNPSNGHIVARYPATGGAGGIAVTNGALGVANFGNDSVWREPIASSG
jgi:hypothetical protein